MDKEDSKNSLIPTLDVSVLVPIVERHDDLGRLFVEFSETFRSRKMTFEFIFIVDGDFQAVFESLKELKKAHEEIKIVKLSKSFGESTALTIGAEYSKGQYIFTLASYFQVEPAVEAILSELDSGCDLVITRRFPRKDSVVNRVQSFFFHWLIRKMTAVPYHDVSCGFRGMKRKVMEEINLYGDLHRFFPILAEKYGFTIKEINVPQRKEDMTKRLVSAGSYVRRLLDILSIFFVTKFTMKPLRFFGLIGSTLLGSGVLITSYLCAYRFFGYGGIAHRPLLLLGVILIVIGVQALSIGLIGEIIIFTHARNMKEYNIEEYLTNE